MIRKINLWVLLIGLSVLSNYIGAQDVSSEEQRALKAFQAGDERTFVEIHESLMKRGHTDSQINLGIYYLQKRNFVKSEQLLKPLAEKGNSEAQFHLGGLYLTQSPPKTKEATEWLKKAADQGNVRARRTLDGMGRPQPNVIIKNGKASTSQILTIGIPEVKEAFGQPEYLRCYKIEPSQLSKIFDPIASACIRNMEARYGQEVAYSESVHLNIFTAWVACIREGVMKSQGVSVKELTDCNSGAK